MTPEYADRNAAVHLLRVCSRQQRRGYMYGTQQSKARSVRQARDVYRREFIGRSACGSRLPAVCKLTLRCKSGRDNDVNASAQKRQGMRSDQINLNQKSITPISTERLHAPEPPQGRKVAQLRYTFILPRCIPAPLHGRRVALPRAKKTTRVCEAAL